MLILIIGVLIVLGTHQRDKAVNAVGLNPEADAARLNLLGCREVYIGEIRLVFKGFPLEPFGVHIVCQLNLAAGHHGNLMTGAG